MNFLRQFVREERLQRFEEILKDRTSYITLVIEDVYQPQNASAVMRTCECLGIQNLHIIEQNNKYVLNKDVVVGASKWVRVLKHRKNSNNTQTCYQRLREEGYRIIATTPNDNGHTPETLPLDQKIAIVLGTEGDGLSETAKKEADGFLQIPMYGFTESYNISVAAAIISYQLIHRLRNEKMDWRLNEDEKNEVMIRWMKNELKRSDLIESEFYTRHGGKK